MTTENWIASIDSADLLSSFVGAVALIESNSEATFAGRITGGGKGSLVVEPYEIVDQPERGFYITTPGNIHDATLANHPVVPRNGATIVVSPVRIDRLPPWGPERPNSYRLVVRHEPPDEEDLGSDEDPQYPVAAALLELLLRREETVVHLDYNQQEFVESPEALDILNRFQLTGIEGRILGVTKVSTLMANNVSVTLELWQRGGDEAPEATLHEGPKGERYVRIPVLRPQGDPVVVKVAMPTAFAVLEPWGGDWDNVFAHHSFQ